MLAVVYDLDVLPDITADTRLYRDVTGERTLLLKKEKKYHSKVTVIEPQIDMVTLELLMLPRS